MDKIMEFNFNNNKYINQTKVIEDKQVNKKEK